jgi:hypothetical protein
MTYTHFRFRYWENMSPSNSWNTKTSFFVGLREAQSCSKIHSGDSWLSTELWKKCHMDILYMIWSICGKNIQWKWSLLGLSAMSRHPGLWQITIICINTACDPNTHHVNPSRRRQKQSLKHHTTTPYWHDWSPKISVYKWVVCPSLQFFVYF